MPPFLRALPLPASLTTDLPRPVAAGIGLAVSLPGMAFQTALALPATLLGTTAKIVGRYQELAEIGVAVVTGRRAEDDDDDVDFPAVEGWGDSTYEVERRLRAIDPEPETEIEPERETEPEPESETELETEPEIGDEVPIEVPDELARAAADREQQPTEVLDRRDLPLPDYPSLSAASLRAHVGALSVTELEQLRDYEQAHAKRLTVLQLLERTIAKKS